jgi:hypothetical protein
VTFLLEVVMPHTPLLKRVRAEYLEMPGMRLTLEQAQRLFGAERTLCVMVLDALVADRFLCVKLNGAYARSTEGDIARLRPAKADLGVERRVATVS